MTKKHDKILSDMEKELAEFKAVNAETKELNQLLKDQVIEYQQVIKSFNKNIPKGMFT